MAHASISIEGSLTKAAETARQRALVVAVCVVFCFAGVLVRLVDLAFAGEDRAEHHLAGLKPAEITFSRRGIVDRNGTILATNLHTVSLFANPQKIQDAEEVVIRLKEVLPDLNEDVIYERLISNRQFVWIKRDLTPREQYAVNNLGMPGLDFQKQETRTYPHGEMASHVLGLVGQEGKGMAGVEMAQQQTLSQTWDNARPLQLTLDIRVQNVLEEELAAVMKKYSAVGAAGAVMDVHTGELLAMVSLPSYDPNLPEALKTDRLFNRMAQGVYEMGSTFKTFTFAQALEAKKISLKSTVDAKKPIKIGRFYIHDFKPKNRILTVPEAFMFSSNIATARIADAMGPEAQQAFYQQIGLTEPIDIGLQEQGKPMIPDRWSRIKTLTGSYGHGLGVTPLHVLAGMSAMVNGGEYISPTLMAGQQPQRRRVISEDTSQKIRRLLRLVVKEGTGRNAEAEGYLVGGKTGTAEKAINGRYSDTLLTSFAGAFPMDKPRYALIAVMDEPKGIKESFGYATAGWTAAPVVSNVVKRIAPILGVAPVSEGDTSREDALKVAYELRPGTTNATIHAPKAE